MGLACWVSNLVVVRSPTASGRKVAIGLSHASFVTMTFSYRRHFPHEDQKTRDQTDGQNNKQGDLEHCNSREAMAKRMAASYIT